MLLKSTVSIQQEVEINLETPAFFKNPLTFLNEYLGVIDECTISMWSLDGEQTTIKNTATEKSVSQIKTAYDSWEHISEEEFFEALDKALKDFNFKPSLRHITAKEGSEVTI
jgi:hypothetical protein